VNQKLLAREAADGVVVSSRQLTCAGDSGTLLVAALICC